jgi:uncharacterized protein
VAGPAIIDGHVHIMPWHLARPEIVAKLRATQPNFAQIQKYVKDPRAFIRLLDDEGIEKACLINYVAPEVMGFPTSVNEWVHKYTKEYRDRLIPFGGIHPAHTKNPRADVEKLLNTYELGGIKLHPVHSLFRVNDYAAGDGALRILYAACEAEGVPVMVHTGTSIFPNARNKFGDPMDIDDVAVDFPKLPIVIAHAGRPLWMETAMFLVRRHPNVHLDLSGIPPKKILEYLPDLEKIADRALFGSDWPGPMVPSMRQNAMDLNAQRLTAEAKRKILSGNARRLYG